MTKLKIEITVKNITDAHRLMFVLKRKSFPVENTIDDFRIQP